MNQDTTLTLRSSAMRTALWLVGATLAYNVIEAVVAIWSGAEAHSIALLGFGFDSVIECAAALVLFWRLSKEARGATGAELEATERQVHRFVGVTFFALALYVMLQAAWTLWKQEAPEESVIGILLAFASLIIMPVIAFWKLRIAKTIRSGALRAEAKETLACSYLSFALLVGLLANSLAGLWWADPVAALLMVPWLIKEGLEGIRGGCCGDEECDAH